MKYFFILSVLLVISLYSTLTVAQEPHIELLGFTEIGKCDQSDKFEVLALNGTCVNVPIKFYDIFNGDTFSSYELFTSETHWKLALYSDGSCTNEAHYLDWIYNHCIDLSYIIGKTAFQSMEAHFFQ
eukprot:TRINITY_DN8001_c0_g1_i1.p1 TRINITY_DN8001_c0_g1~~TRINITY_DN8001_c0_g1_i1.p1  ORF type:complete len:127 (+),score=7.57 TRINITY_DN8001_c0_g1_i1:38-418(+)